MSNSRRSPSPPPSIASTHHSILPSVQSSSYFHGSNSNSSHTSAISSLSAPLQTGRSSLSGWSGENSDFGSSNNDFEFGIEGEGATETRGHWHGGMINQGSNSGGIEYEKQIQQGPGGIKAKPFIQKLAYVLSKPEYVPFRSTCFSLEKSSTKRVMKFLRIKLQFHVSNVLEEL